VADACVESFGNAVAAGVKIAMGTDLGNMSGENLAELVAMRAAGMSASDALVVATSSAAELMGLSAEVGSVTGGKIADPGRARRHRPFDLATMTKWIRRVYQGNRLVQAAEPVLSGRV
jgi:imidazolonepropionase-like amidohydrolase